MVEIDEGIRLVFSHEGGDGRLCPKQSMENPAKADAGRLLDPLDLRQGSGLGGTVDGNAADTELRFRTLIERHHRTAEGEHQAGKRQQRDLRSVAKWGYTHCIQAL